MIGKKIYLGDSVYAQYDGYHIVLTTENGLPDDPSNTIALESTVLFALNRFREVIVEWVNRVEKSIVEEIEKTPPIHE